MYSADYTPIIAYHRSTGADLTIVCRPVSGEQACRLGVVKVRPGECPATPSAQGNGADSCLRELVKRKSRDAATTPIRPPLSRKAA